MCYVRAGSYCRNLVRQVFDLRPQTLHMWLGGYYQHGRRSFQSFQSNRYFGKKICRGSAMRRPRLVSCLDSGHGYSWESARAEACHYSFLPLDRAGEMRKSVETYLKNEKAKVVIFVDGKPALVKYQPKTAHMSFWLDAELGVPVDAEGQPVELIPFVIESSDDFLCEFGDRDPGSIFLGVCKKDGETPVFVQDIGCVSEEFLREHELIVKDARSAGPQICAEDSSLLALSNGLLRWHKNTQFCSKTGKKASEIVLGGHGRRVASVDGASTRSIYPRIDPAVIVVAMHGDWFLLGRKASWDAGRYSLLAGFVELGETFEEASVREVFEESGVKLNLQSLEYQRSQPWPFPQSLMVSFKGETLDFVNAASGFELLSRDGQNAAKHAGLLEQEINPYRSHLTVPEVHIDEDELEDARFFHSSWLVEHLQSSNEFRIPGKHALANRLIHQNLEQLSARDDQAFLQLQQVPELGVPVESSNQMKYVLLRASFASPDGSWKSKLILRGDPRAAYHNHVYTAAKTELALLDRSYSLQLDVLGGGRMEVDATEKSISVYGFSAAFGQAPHEITGAILRANLPFHSVNISYEGY